MQTVPLIVTPSQTLLITLNMQICRINVYQKLYGVFLDLYFNGQTKPIIGGVYCLDRVRIVRDAYLGFVGDIAFFDTQGADKPYWSGLGDRWQLAYLTPADLKTVGVT